MYDGTVWEPRNFDGEYLGVVSLRYGFKNSRNIVAVKLMNDEDNHGIGARNVILYAHKMGINTYIPEVRSIAIGSAEVKLIEIVSAYTVFPNFGIKTDNFSIKRIDDKNNLLIYQQTNGEKSEVLIPEVASLMITMMKGVTSESKGTAAAIIGNSVMKDRPCAGKTGTAQDFKDAWFIGYTPYIACGVWIGFDSEETTLRNPLHTGATASLPVWINFMSKASEVLGYPKDDFKLSKNITIRRLCRDSYLLAGPNCPDSTVYNEYFIPGTEVTTFCNVHNPKIQGSPNSRFISDDLQKRR